MGGQVGDNTMTIESGISIKDEIISNRSGSSHGSNKRGIKSKNALINK